MIYAKVDVKLRDHIRAHKAGVAMSTWLWALLYVREQETDGIVPEIAIRLAWAGEKEARQHAKALILAGLWEVIEDGWRICRYDTKNETRAAIAERRAEARVRMTRVRANNQRTRGEHPTNEQRPNGEPSGREQIVVPGSGSGSGSGSEIKIQEEISSARARPDPSAKPPDWWDAVLATVGMNTGVDLPGGEAWLRYAGHRAGKALAASREDALYWLTTVMVPEARKGLAETARQRDRDMAFARQRAGPGTTTEPIVETAEAQRVRGERLAREAAERVAARKRGAA